MEVRYRCWRCGHSTGRFMTLVLLLELCSSGTSAQNATINVFTVAPSYNGWPLAIGGVDLRSTCKASGFAPGCNLSFEWRLNGTVVSVSSAISTSAGSATSSLVIVSPGRKDVGWYSCIASSGNSTVQASTYVYVAYVETSSLLVTSEALPGQTVTLRCLVTSFPPDLIYTWYRGGAMIAGQSSSVYSVANFSQSSAGNYTCKASGTYASVQVVFGVALLTPPVIQKVNTTFVTVGNTLQLTCTADSVHLPSYSWRSGNQSITNTSRVTVSVGGSRSGQLLVRQVVYNDSGVYTCVATNSIGRDTADFPVVVQGPPHVSVPGGGVVITPEGSTPSLVCSWIAYPTPSVTWTMTGGGGVSTGGRYSSPSVGTLVIGQVGGADEGMYLCSFSNALGNGTGSIQLVVIDKPTGLVVSNVGGHSLELRWNAITSRTRVDQYVLEYGVQDNPSSKNVTFPGNSTTGKVWGLSAGSTYLLRLKAVKLGVAGTPGNQIMATTTTTAPVLALVSINPLDDGRSLQVRWHISDTGGMSIQAVNVTVLLNGSVVQTLTVQPSWGESCLVSGLMPTTSYTIEVAASNAVGVTSVASSIITPLAPPSTPTKPSIVAETSHSISMKTFIDSIGSAPVQFILINVSELHSGQSQVINASINDSSVVQYSSDVTTTSLGISLLIEDVEGHLKPYEIYTFAVAAQSVVGTGPFSEPTDPASLEWDYILYAISGGTGGIILLIIVALSCVLLYACVKNSRRRRELSVDPQSVKVHKVVSSSSLGRQYAVEAHSSRSPSHLPSYSSCELHKGSALMPHRSPLSRHGTADTPDDCSISYPNRWGSGFDYAETHSAHNSVGVLHGPGSIGHCVSPQSGVGSVSDIKASPLAHERDFGRKTQSL
eukprot:Em0006g559a